MSTIKNGQILLHFHFNKIEEPGTSSQSPAFSQKHAENVFAIQHLVFDNTSI